MNEFLKNSKIYLFMYFTLTLQNNLLNLYTKNIHLSLNPNVGNYVLLLYLLLFYILKCLYKFV